MKEMKKLLSNFKKMWPYAREAKKDIIIDVVGMTFLSLIGFIRPFLDAKLLIFLTTIEFDKVLMVCLIIFVLEVLRNTFNAMCSKHFRLFYQTTVTNLRIDILKRALKIEMSELDNNSSGVFIDRINKDAGNIPDILDSIENVLLSLIVNTGVLITIFFINKILFIYIVLAVSIIFTIEKISITKRFVIDKKRRKINERITSLIGESIRGIRDIKVLNADNRILDKSEREFRSSMRETLEMNKIRYRYRWLSGTTKDFYQLFLIVIGIVLITNNMLSLENFIIIFMYRDRIQNLLTEVIWIAEKSKEFNLSFDRVFEIIEEKKFKKEKFGNKNILKLRGNIEFRDVNFSYKDQPTLRNLSFKVEPNQIIAFVGKTGAGKTTVFNLINKLYTIENNMIFLDNKDINTLNKNSIRNNISLVTQNPYLFNFSILENLKIVNNKASLKEIKAVCKKACIDEFIEALPDKYDTVIGEGGVTLSGGQKQRIAIARALLKKSEVILFDEATSSLDNQTQHFIKEAINNIKGEKTVLIVAHRLSTIIDADKIFVLDNGTKVGEGTHEELLKNNSIYKELYESEV